MASDEHNGHVDIDFIGFLPDDEILEQRLRDELGPPDFDEPKIDGQDRGYPAGVKRRRVDVPEPEPEIEGDSDEDVYGYYEEEEDFDLWGHCPFVEESLRSEKFTKRELSETGLRLVKARLSGSGLLSVKVVDLERQWRKLHKAEAELDLFRAELLRAQTELVVKALED